MMTERRLGTTLGTHERRKRRKTRRARDERLLSAKAPVNTTQFLMADTSAPCWEPLADKEFETRQFKRDYETAADTVASAGGAAGRYTSDNGGTAGKYTNSGGGVAERYSNLGKEELIQEYLSLEKGVNRVEAKVRSRFQGLEQLRGSEQLKGLELRHELAPSLYSADLLERIRLFEAEISQLAAENLQLAAENQLLADNSCSDSDSSSSSSSSCSSSSCSSCSSSDTEDEQDKLLDDCRRDDTGYESENGTGLLVSSST